MQELAQRSKYTIFINIKVAENLTKDERAMLTKNKLVVMPNLQQEAAMLEWAGIDFGEAEIYKLNKSMKVRHLQT